MATWSSRRKFLIGGSFVVVVLAVVVAVYFAIFYKAPTCSDGLRNGDEQGIDCGGSCVKLCQSFFIPPKISWGGGKYEKVADGLYNVAALVINPNTNVAAVNVPYRFSIFDNKGILITERKGTTFIPAHRNILVFETAIDVGKRMPSKVTFEFLEPPVWFKSRDTLEGIAIVDKKYQDFDNSSSLEVTLENRSLVPYKDVITGVVLYDKNENAIGFSRTQIDVIHPKGSGQNRELAPYTWPVERKGEVVSIEAYPVVYPVRN